jgi:predicted RNase H-like nuclease (RuvC/YqgF family)
VRNNIRQWVIGISLACAVGVGGGCAKVPPCTVSPIDIEETREDVKVLQKDLAAARARAKELREELAAKQAEHDSKKDKPDELRKKLDDLKKGSGRDESQKRKKKDDDKESA